METLRFRAFPRWLIIAQTLVALVATPTGVFGLVAGETLQGILLLALGLVSGIAARSSPSSNSRSARQGCRSPPASGQQL
jgi:hypothetical protein